MGTQFQTNAPDIQLRRGWLFMDFKQGKQLEFSQNNRSDDDNIQNEENLCHLRFVVKHEYTVTVQPQGRPYIVY